MDTPQRAFSELRQPASAAAANATIDSVGFDFIQQPRVECSYMREGDELVVRILEFESEAYAARPSDVDIADRAMVMADYDYDGTVFDLDAVAYAEDLEARQWELRIPVSEIGTKIMLIYLDLYGNEHREIKEVGDFAAQEPTESRRAPQRAAGRTGAA
jgi:site-specific DNA-methyltransferase (adenine-specific)/adenine-specific DNA-methyltransferase